MNSADCARYQLIARATNLPKGYLTKPRLRLRLRYQLVAAATYLAKPRFKDSAHSRAWSR